MFQRTESLPLELPQQGTLRPRRQTLQRSQSEIVDTTKSATTSPYGPPDITAIDLANEPIRRAYSQVDVRSRRLTQMPPLEQMTGFGKYRRSIHADPEWQMQQYRLNLRDFPGLVPQLGDFKLADPDPLLWDQFCQESARSNSFASSHTSHSDSGECPINGAGGRRQGTVITRGFVRSTSSSAASSLRGGSNSLTRKESATSTSPSGESDNNLVRFSSRQSTLSLLCEPTALTAITEDLAGDLQTGCKVSQFLECDEGGDVENALESDYEDENDVVSTQLDGTKSGVRGNSPLTLRTRGARQTNLAQRATLLQTKGQDLRPSKPRDPRSGLDRSATVIRKPIRPALRRSMSRGKPPSSRRVSILENAPTTGKKIKSGCPESGEPTSLALTSSDESMEDHETLCELGLYTTEANDSSVYPLQHKEDPKGSFQEDPTTQIVITEIKPNLPTKMARHTRRNRSGTAIRTVSKTAQV